MNPKSSSREPSWQLAAKAELERRRRSESTEVPSPDTVLEWQDDERFCADSLTVYDKSGRPASGKWGFGQRRLFEAIAKQRAQGKPIRVIYLKPRQAWISTGTAMKLFKETAFIPGQSALVVAHDEKSALKIFEYYKRFHKHYKPFHDIPLPDLITPKNLDNPLQTLMKWSNESYVQVETANNLAGGRSFTARRIHLSEYAFYRNASVLMTGLMQSMPDDPETMLIIESTANGMGGAFYDAWVRAVEGKNDFIPVFLAWWEHEEYVRPIEVSVEEFVRSMTDTEHELMHTFNLQLARLNWRRWTIANKCDGDEDRFRQEYPSTPEEAFLSSGRPRFRPVYIQKHTAVEPAIRGELRVEQVGVRSETFLEANEYGALSIWQRPQAGHGYVIGADTSEGIDANEGGSPDSDYSVGDVFEASVGLQVAQLRERLTPSEFGRYLYELGRFYNWAYIVPEVNGIGQSTVDTLIAMGYPTDRLYHRVIYDKDGRPATDKIGFKTTPQTRDQWIGAYESALAGFGDGGLILRSAASIREAYSFKVKTNGRAEAEAGTHDDTVTSGGLAAIGLPYARALFEAKEQATHEKQHEKYDPMYAPTASERAANAFYGSQQPTRDLSRFKSRM